MNAHNIETLNDHEIDAIGGGIILTLSVIGVIAAGAAAANELMELGANIHDAVCKH